MVPKVALVTQKGSPCPHRVGARRGVLSALWQVERVGFEWRVNVKAAFFYADTPFVPIG